MRIEEIRSGLVARLRARRPEIEQAAMTRVRSVSNLSEISDPEYAEGLRAAIAVAIEYGITTLERDQDRLPTPPLLLAQARLAARIGIRLDAVVRRYLAGYTLLGDFLIEESEKGRLLNAAPLQRLLRAQAAAFDHVLAAVSEEYTSEAQTRPASLDQGRIDRVKGLLAGELLDVSGLGYNFDASHLGVIASGDGSEEAVRALAGALDCRPLVIHPVEGTTWAWLGSRAGIEPEELDRLIPSQWPEDAVLALGEPGQGLGGWRLTHEQARAAVAVALRSPERLARYGEVAVLASTLRDDVLSTSLRQLYLAPLESERDGGKVARNTLRAYFAADRNASSAAASLAVSRRTVTNRLRAIEEKLGRSLSGPAVEMETALRLHELEGRLEDGKPRSVVQAGNRYTNSFS